MSRRRRVRRLTTGATLVETLAAVWVLGLLTTLLLALGGAANRATDRRFIEDSLRARGRNTLDEMTREIRAANLVQSGQTFGGQAVTTGAANLVLRTSGYDPARSGGSAVLSANDVTAFRFDAAAGTLAQTTAVAAGSSRPARAGLILARRVQSVAYTYFVRDRFVADGVALAYTLKARPAVAPTAYVDGIAVASVWTPGASTVTLAAKPAAKADVQFVYAVDPAANGGAALARVSRVDIVLTLGQTDGRGVARSVILAGSALLRNLRS